MTRHILISIALLAPNLAFADWKPPENPDPHEILQEAKNDARSGRYEDALAKHLWFHEHSLGIDKSFYGVRLSFALSYWHELAKVYPPAMVKLKEVRDKAYRQVFESKEDATDQFHDFQSINETLGEPDRTVAAFKRLDSKDSEKAKAIYRIVQSDLVRAKEYKLCGKYLDHGETHAQRVEMYEYLIKSAGEENSPNFKRHQLEYAEKSFLNESATQIALLVLNDRKPEAEEIAKQVREKSKHDKRDAVIDAALGGKPPKQD